MVTADLEIVQMAYFIGVQEWDRIQAIPFACMSHREDTDMDYYIFIFISAICAVFIIAMMIAALMMKWPLLGAPPPKDPEP